MKTKIIKFAAAVIFLAFYPAQADTVWTSGHHDILPGDVYAEIWMYDDATATMLGGDVYKVETFGQSAFDMLGGHMDLLYVHDNTTIDIYAGSLGALGVVDDGSVQLYAYDVIYYPTGGGYDRGWVEGKYLLNDLAFSFDLDDLSTFSHISVVPEPTTLLLMGLGGLLLRKRR